MPCHLPIVLTYDGLIRLIIDHCAEYIRRHKNPEGRQGFIARIVAFRDPYLAEQKPELAVKTLTGEIFRDKNGLFPLFSDPALIFLRICFFVGIPIRPFRFFRYY